MEVEKCRIYDYHKKGISLSLKANDYEAKARGEAAKFDLSSLPEDLRRQMRQLTYKQLEREDLDALSAAISGRIARTKEVA